MEVSSRLLCGSFQKSCFDSKMNLLSFFATPSAVLACAGFAYSSSQFEK